MTSFPSLLKELVHSSIWQEPPATCKVYATMIAICDRPRGEVITNIKNLASLSHVSYREVVAALRYLLSPDPREEDQTHYGQKIRKIEKGWVILDYSKKRRVMAKDELRAYERRKQQEWRKRKKAGLIIAKEARLVKKDEDFVRSFYLPRTKPAHRICHIMKRLLTTCWTMAEIKAFRALGEIHDEDLLYVEEYYNYWRKRGPNAHNKLKVNFITFLKSFRQEVMKAKADIPRWKIEALINGVNSINHRQPKEGEQNGQTETGGVPQSS